MAATESEISHFAFVDIDTQESIKETFKVTDTPVILRLEKDKVYHYFGDRDE